jgi:hypothetical protein
LARPCGEKTMESVGESIEFGYIYRLVAVHGASWLDREQTDRILAKEIQARRKLEEEVNGFLSAMCAKAEILLDRNPTSADLLRYFERYAQSVFDAAAQEVLPFAFSLPEKIGVLNTILAKVHYLICSGKDGVWNRTISLGCDAVNLGSWSAGYGAYGRATLVVPRRKQLATLLRAHAMSWAVALSTGTAERPTPEALEEAQRSRNILPNAASIATPRTQLAELLRSVKKERHWTMEELAKNCGVSLGTLKNVFKRRKPSESTLTSIEKCLTHSLGHAVRIL